MPDITTSSTMTTLLPQSCFKQLARGSLLKRSLAFPSHLSRSQPTQCFSTTPPAQSRVGGAAISIPPEVTLGFVNLPQTQARGAGKDQPKIAIEVNGPLGGWSFISSSDACSNMITRRRPKDSQSPLVPNCCTR